MSAYLNKEELLLKLSHFGFSTKTSINRLIREQGLPTKYFSPRKPFWDEAEVDVWLSRRNKSIANANAKKAKYFAKIAAKQRKAQQENAIQASAATAVPAAA